ncbi:hypothetical protein H4F44_26320, partial [Escherichia coli]|uniref:hypothetical protein n=1 Tax=Escherichia coli TaxID=562 RepID=UPI00197D69CA
SLMDNISADELLHELSSLEATMAQVVRCAGVGSIPDLERRLDAHARSLRVLLDAAKRVLMTAEPDAPLMMLSMARATLAAMVRRQASRSMSHK